MAWAFYDREAEFYKDDFRAHLPLHNKDRVEHFVKAICDHYKISIPKVTYNGKKWHRCLWDPPRLNFVEGRVTLQYLSHELAHHVEYQLNENTRHNHALARRVEGILAHLYDFVLTDSDRLGMKAINTKQLRT